MMIQFLLLLISHLRLKKKILTINYQRFFFDSHLPPPQKTQISNTQNPYVTSGHSFTHLLPHGNLQNRQKAALPREAYLWWQRVEKRPPPSLLKERKGYNLHSLGARDKYDRRRRCWRWRSLWPLNGRDLPLKKAGDTV